MEGADSVVEEDAGVSLLVGDVLVAGVLGDVLPEPLALGVAALSSGLLPSLFCTSSRKHCSFSLPLMASQRGDSIDPAGAADVELPVDDEVSFSAVELCAKDAIGRAASADVMTMLRKFLLMASPFRGNHKTGASAVPVNLMTA
jgi:hypothetical protein